MLSSIRKVGNYALLFSILLADCPLLTAATGTETSSPLPVATPIPWESKIDSFREFILQQPDQNATKGFGWGPGFQQKFPDGQCLQIRFYNWDCFHDIPYKMRGVLKWFDSTSARTQPITDFYRDYTYGYYVDPDDGWNFYNAARLSFGGCGNRGPQSSCGVNWCVDKSGTTPKDVPPGQTPYLDPNNKDNLCPWLKEESS